MNTASSMYGQGGTVLVVFVGGGLLFWDVLSPIVDLMLPDGVGQLPKYMTVPVRATADSVAAFPWDQPAKD